MKNKKYLVLGAGSFLGSSFLDHMMKSNYEIFGISSFQRNKNIIGSDYSKNSLDNVLRDFNPDVVMILNYQKLVVIRVTLMIALKQCLQIIKTLLIH